MIFSQDLEMLCLSSACKVSTTFQLIYFWFNPKIVRCKCYQHITRIMLRLSEFENFPLVAKKVLKYKQTLPFTVN